MGVVDSPFIAVRQNNPFDASDSRIAHELVGPLGIVEILTECFRFNEQAWHPAAAECIQPAERKASQEFCGSFRRQLVIAAETFCPIGPKVWRSTPWCRNLPHVPAWRRGGMGRRTASRSAPAARDRSSGSGPATRRRCRSLRIPAVSKPPDRGCFRRGRRRA